MRHFTVAMVVLAALVLAVGGCSKDKSGGSGDSGGGKERTTSGGESTKPVAPKVDSPAKQPAVSGELVRTGMTMDEVTKVLGEPTSQFGAEADGKEVMTCVWEKGNTVYTVQFHDGKVMAVHTGTDSSGEPAAGGAEVKKNFSKVRIGMSEAEVVKLLGPPTQSGSTAGEGEMTFVVKVWEVGESTYTVSFLNGKVQVTHKDEGEE